MTQFAAMNHHAIRLLLMMLIPIGIALPLLVAYHTTAAAQPPSSTPFVFVTHTFTPTPEDFAPPTATPTPQPIASPVIVPSSTPFVFVTNTPPPSPTDLPTATPTLTPSTTPTPSDTPTPTITPTPTQPLWTLTPVSNAGAPPAFESGAAGFSATDGWSCGDFPCDFDIAGFLRRIQVPRGYVVEHVGQFPGQPMQIVYGPDGRLYGTVLEDGKHNGAVYALNADGSSERYSSDLISPVGLAFQPGTDVLYVSARETALAGGGLWRVPPGGGTAQQILTGLPCCYSIIDNQPNGMIFGPDGLLYLGVGALTDHGEGELRDTYANILPLEASILRVQVHTAEVEVVASGIRNPYDLAFDSRGRFFATDQGLITGVGDRLLAIESGRHYGWPYWRTRGCGGCPPRQPGIDIAPDLLRFPQYSTPRGIVAYTGTQFPANLFDDLFVVLWGGVEGGQRVVRIDPDDPNIGNPDYTPEPFITGLIRPIDVAIAPDGSLVVADFIHGHVWRVRYVGV